MPNVFRSTNVKRLIKALAALQNEEEARRFLDAALSPQELTAVAQRFAIAEKAIAHKKSYEQTIAETGASTATVARVRRQLFVPGTNQFTADGEIYATLISRMDDE